MDKGEEKKVPDETLEWLGRARGTETEIRTYRAAIREIRDRMERITSAPPDGLPHAASDPHRQEKLYELEECLREKADELCGVQREIANAIWKLKSTKQRTVLFSYYVRCKTLEQIAEEMDCSARNVQNLRKRGVREI